MNKLQKYEYAEKMIQDIQAIITKAQEDIFDTDEGVENIGLMMSMTVLNDEEDTIMNASTIVGGAKAIMIGIAESEYTTDFAKLSLKAQLLGSDDDSDEEGEEDE